LEYIHDFKINPYDLISSDWIRPFDKEEYMTKYVKDWRSIFNEETVDKFEPHVQKVMIFNKPKDWNESSKGNSVHIDEGGITCALNIVLPTENNSSIMQWYETDIPSEELLIGSQSNYAKRWNEESWNQDRFQLIHEEFIDNKVCLVRVDIPHKIVVCQSARVCISVRFRNILSMEWNDAIGYVDKLLN